MERMREPCSSLLDKIISAVKAAIHAVQKLFDDKETEAILLVDVLNAFSCLNRQVDLQNIRRLCPSLATILMNT